MAILSGPEIHRQVELGKIRIEPYDPSRLNPNSYNLRLGNELMEYHGRQRFDPRRGILPGGHRVTIPEEGYVLTPGKGYLGHSLETTYCEGFVPVIDGRSSTGRSFLLIHCTAGFGDDGFSGEWTLEIVPLIEEVVVYPGDEMLQIRFHTMIGKRDPYKGKYQGQKGPTSRKRDIDK